MSDPVNIQLGHEHHENTGKKFPLCLLANDITSESNVGSLFRLADALGVECLYLTGKTPRPPGAKLGRSARATDKAVAWSYYDNPHDVITSLSSKGYTLVALELSTASTDIGRFKLLPGEKVCIIAGSEKSGVSQALLDSCDKTVHIPMLGQNSSMNVAVACAIAVYELTRQMRLTES